MQKACRSSRAESKKHPRPGEQSRQQKRHMTRQPQVITGDIICLGWTNPEIEGTLQAEPCKASWMFSNKLVQFPLLQLHKADFTKFLKLTHCFQVISRMLAARPEPL